MDDAALMRAMGLPVGFGGGTAARQSAHAPASASASASASSKAAAPAVPASKAKDAASSSKSARQDDDNDNDDDLIGPPMPPQASARVAGSDADAKTGSSKSRRPSDSDDDEDDDDDGDDASNAFEADALPIAERAALRDHLKSVTALALDSGGGRFISAGRDNMVKMWDFYGMNVSMKPFRSFEPVEGNPIRDVQFNAAGDKFLVAPSTNQMKIYDREGSQLLEFVKGDPYIRDLRHTKGHVAALTCGRWHPHDKKLCLSASLDGTIRIWDVEAAVKQKDVIVVRSKQAGGRTNVTAAAYSNDGKMIAGAASDGALRIWNASGPYINPTHTAENAHMQGGSASSVSFSINNQHILTRAMDDTLKLWDIRNFKKPVAAVPDLPTFYEETNAIFSPNDRYVLTGTSVKKGVEKGSILVFDRHTLESVQEIPMDSPVVRVLWSGKLNQIFAGTGDGSVQVLYDPVMSMGGIKAPLARKPKKLAVDDYAIAINPHGVDGPIFTPGAHMRGEKPRSKRKVHEEEINKRRPEVPSSVSGHGKGGKLGTSVMQHMMRNFIDKDERRQEDPREAILKFAEEAAANPFFVTPAYKDNKQVFSEKVYEDDMEQVIAERKKRRQ
ncbi:WD40-repeat-containing domain protein [Entophlyctis helioformis]|nr:WD40-repeat-containing domain protein [Entophlyctis helioformis]